MLQYVRVLSEDLRDKLVTHLFLATTHAARRQIFAMTHFSIPYNTEGVLINTYALHEHLTASGL